jgi:tetratricopeptide (TPR) repeat protein
MKKRYHVSKGGFAGACPTRSPGNFAPPVAPRLRSATLRVRLRAGTGVLVYPRRMGRRHCLLLAAWVAAATSVGAQQPLPAVPLDTFPEAPRKALGRALDDARADPADPQRLGRLAMLLHAWEQYETASLLYARAAAAERRFEWFYLAGLVETRLARHVDAAKLLKEAVALDPTSVPARLALADALFASDEVDAALALYTRLTDGPGAPHARYGLGRALAARGDTAGALRELETAVALYPEFGAAWYAIGMARRNAGLRDEAGAALAKAQEFGARWPSVDDPLVSHVRALRDDASAHAERGLQRERQGDVTGAIQAYEAALAVDPATVAPRVNLIALYGRQQEWRKAAAHYEALTYAGATVPAEAHYNHGVCLAAQGKIDAAADLFQLAVSLNPQYAGAWSNLGQIAEMRGRIEEAETHYRQAAEQAPADAAPHFNLARMLIARRKYAEAIAALQPVVARDVPERPQYLFALATAHVLSGDVPTGRGYAVEARDLARAGGRHELADSIDRELARLRQ